MLSIAYLATVVVGLFTLNEKIEEDLASNNKVLIGPHYSLTYNIVDVIEVTLLAIILFECTFKLMCSSRFHLRAKSGLSSREMLLDGILSIFAVIFFILSIFTSNL